MIRCPACGRRIPDAAPLCAQHGAPPPAPPPAEDAAVPFVVPTPELPAYRVRKTIGQGGFGAVFLAERISDGDPVAIKVARADNASASEALLREAEALANVGVPYVPAVFERGTLPDGSAYVVMEFVRATILADRMAALDGAMDLEEFARQALAILTVIEVAHGRGLVHCDLKPENVFIDLPDGAAKLFDFGLVRRVGRGAEQAEATKEEAPAGTPEYMSPEQCEGRIDIDFRSDIYALGVIFYEMLAGAPPFWGNPAEVQQSHRSRRPPAISRRVTIAVALEDAIMRCLAKDPARRFPSAAELRRALSAGLTAERARREGASGVVRIAGNDGALADPKGTAKAAGPGRERRAVALLFFESRASVATVREAMNSVGAQLANTAGAQYVLAFGHEVGDNPTRAAATAGEMFIARGLTKRVLVDLASVSIQVRPDGSRRYQSPFFTKKEQYPGEEDGQGVLISPAAAEVLPDLPVEPVPSRPGFVVLKKVAQESERTTTRMGVAPLVGRDDVLRTLLDAARAATSGGLPTITTLVGEAGYGKTHLAQMLVQHLEVLPRLEALFVRAKEVLGGVGDQTTRELLQRTLSLPETAPEDLGRALLIERLGPAIGREVWAGVAVSMGWAPPDHPELRSLAAAPGALRSATARAAGEGLRLMARRRPIALVIEDAHFADETALDAIEYATLKEAKVPLWVCVVGRPSFGRGRTAWAGRAGTHNELALRPLEPSAAAELARRLLAPAESVPAAALARLAERTQGIPMLLVELVRGLKRDGLVRKSEKGNTWYLATDELERLPDLPLVQWLASRETESLPAELLGHARLASALGTEFTADELEGVLQELERAGVPTDTQLDATIGLSRLVESGILSRHRGARVGFRHALLRDTIYQAVPPPQRESIHRAAYEHYRRRERLPDDARLPQMALHAARCGLKEVAARLYLDLAGRTSARHAYLDAELLFKHALDNLPEGDDVSQIAAAKGRAQMRLRLGRYDDALRDTAAALDRARRSTARGAEVEILLDQATLLDWMGDYPKSRDVAEEADALVGSDVVPKTPPLFARLLMARGRSLMRMDKIQQGLPVLREGVEVAEKLGDEAYEPYTQCLSMLGWGAAIVGRFDEAEEAMSRAVAVSQAHGDMIGLAAALGNRSTLSFLTGKVDRVLEDYGRMAQIGREFGFSMAEAQAGRDLGEIYFILGRLDEAEPQVARVIEMYTQTLGERSSRLQNSQVLLARIKWYQGDVDKAADIVRQVVALQAEARANGWADSLLSEAERINLDALDIALRQAADEEFDALITRARAVPVQPQDVVEFMEVKALAALRGGRRADGIRMLEDALAEGEKVAQLAADRVRRRLERARADGNARTPQAGAG